MASLGYLDIDSIRTFVMIPINSNLESPGIKTEMGAHPCLTPVLFS